jgi:hypothetical protein
MPARLWIAALVTCGLLGAAPAPADEVPGTPEALEAHEVPDAEVPDVEVADPEVPDPEVPEAVELPLLHIELPVALTALRAILGTRELMVLDRGRIAVQGDAATRRLAVELLQRIDVPAGPAPDVPAGEPWRHHVGDGTVVASVYLRYAQLRDVTAALRTDLQIERFATLERSAMLVLRDRPAVVEAALARVEALERRDP